MVMDQDGQQHQRHINPWLRQLNGPCDNIRLSRPQETMNPNYNQQLQHLNFQNPYVNFQNDHINFQNPHINLQDHFQNQNYPRPDHFESQQHYFNPPDLRNGLPNFTQNRFQQDNYNRSPQNRFQQDNYNRSRQHQADRNSRIRLNQQEIAGYQNREPHYNRRQRRPKRSYEHESNNRAQTYKPESNPNNYQPPPMNFEELNYQYPPIRIEELNYQHPPMRLDERQNAPLRVDKKQVNPFVFTGPNSLPVNQSKNLNRIASSSSAPSSSAQHTDSTNNQTFPIPNSPPRISSANNSLPVNQSKNLNRIASSSSAPSSSAQHTDSTNNQIFPISNSSPRISPANNTRTPSPSRKRKIPTPKLVSPKKIKIKRNRQEDVSTLTVGSGVETPLQPQKNRKVTAKVSATPKEGLQISFTPDETISEATITNQAAFRGFFNGPKGQTSDERKKSGLVINVDVDKCDQLPKRKVSVNEHSGQTADVLEKSTSLCSSTQVSLHAPDSPEPQTPPFEFSALTKNISASSSNSPSSLPCCSKGPGNVELSSSSPTKKLTRKRSSIPISRSSKKPSRYSRSTKSTTKLKSPLICTPKKNSLQSVSQSSKISDHPSSSPSPKLPSPLSQASRSTIKLESPLICTIKNTSRQSNSQPSKITDHPSSSQNRPESSLDSESPIPSTTPPPPPPPRRANRKCVDSEFSIPNKNFAPTPSLPSTSSTSSGKRSIESDSARIEPTISNSPSAEKNMHSICSRESPNDSDSLDYNEASLDSGKSSSEHDSQIPESDSHTPQRFNNCQQSPANSENNSSLEMEDSDSDHLEYKIAENSAEENSSDSSENFVSGQKEEDTSDEDLPSDTQLLIPAHFCIVCKKLFWQHDSAIDHLSTMEHVDNYRLVRRELMNDN